MESYLRGMRADDDLDVRFLLDMRASFLCNEIPKNFLERNLIIERLCEFEAKIFR